MTHSFTANLSQSHLNTALLTDDTAMLKPLVLTTKALVIFYRAKNLGTEKTVALWLVSTIVDRLRLQDLTM